MSSLSPIFLEGVVFYLIFVFSVTLHEAAHAWAAKLGGDLTAYHAGQVSLDPIPHMRREPFGMVVLPILSVILAGWPFGFASAPYNPAWAREHPRRAAWMALAGPGSNLALVLLAGLLIRLALSAGVLISPDTVFFSQVAVASTTAGAWGSLAFILSALFSFNLLLAILNLVPVPPLDGYGALPLILPKAMLSAYEEFRRQPMLGWIGILVAWRVLDFAFHPVFLFAVNLLYTEARYG